MPFTDQTALEAVIADYLNRTDLSTQITDAVSLCEARLRRDESMQTLTSTTLTLSTSPVTLPTDFKKAYALYYENDSATFGPIEIVSPAEVMEYRGTYGSTGRPKVAAIIYDSLELILGPAPSSNSYTATLYYDKGMTSTYLLTHFPDIYLYGSLIEMAPLIREDERVPMWEARFRSALEELRRFNERANWHGNVLHRRPRRALGE